MFVSLMAQRLMAMSDEQIAEAREEILSTLPASLVEATRKRGGTRRHATGTRTSTACGGTDPTAGSGDVGEDLGVNSDAEAQAQVLNDDTDSVWAFAQSAVASQRALAAKEIGIKLRDVSDTTWISEEDSGARAEILDPADGTTPSLVPPVPPQTRRPLIENKQLPHILLHFVRDRNASVLLYGLIALRSLVCPGATIADHRSDAGEVGVFGPISVFRPLRESKGRFESSAKPGDVKSNDLTLVVVLQLLDERLIDTLVSLLASRPLTPSIALPALKILMALTLSAASAVRSHVAASKLKLLSCVSSLMEPRALDPQTAPYALSLDTAGASGSTAIDRDVHGLPLLNRAESCSVAATAVRLLRELLNVCEENGPSSTVALSKEMEHSGILSVMAGLLLLQRNAEPQPPRVSVGVGTSVGAGTGACGGAPSTASPPPPLPSTILLEVQFEVVRLLRVCVTNGVGLDAVASIHHSTLQPSVTAVPETTDPISRLVLTLSSVTTAVLKWPSCMWIEWFLTLTAAQLFFNNRRALPPNSPPHPLESAIVTFVSRISGALASHSFTLPNLHVAVAVPVADPDCAGTSCPDAHEAMACSAVMHLIASCLVVRSSELFTDHATHLVKNLVDCGYMAHVFGACRSVAREPSIGAVRDESLIFLPSFTLFASAPTSLLLWDLVVGILELTAVICKVNERQRFDGTTRDQLAQQVERLLVYVETSLPESTAHTAMSPTPVVLCSFERRAVSACFVHGCTILDCISGASFDLAGHAICAVSMCRKDGDEDIVRSLMQQGLFLPSDARVSWDSLAPIFLQALENEENLLPLPRHWLLLPLVSFGNVQTATPVVAATLELVVHLENANILCISSLAPAVRLYHMICLCLYPLDVLTHPSVCTLFARLFADYVRKCGARLAPDLAEAIVLLASPVRVAPVVSHVRTDDEDDDDDGTGIVSNTKPNLSAARKVEISVEFVSDLCTHWLGQSFGDPNHARALRLFLRSGFDPKVQKVVWKEVGTAGLLSLLAEGPQYEHEGIAMRSTTHDAELIDVLIGVLLSSRVSWEEDASHICWLHRVALRNVAEACFSERGGSTWFQKRCLARIGDAALMNALEAAAASLRSGE